MDTLIKTKANRYVKVKLQHAGAKCVSFGEINQCGCVDGYVTGVVTKAFPVFKHSHYGKLRKIILIEMNQDDANDDDDDDDDNIFEHKELSLFTRGNVAEKTADIKKGDIVVLEKPFVESTDKQNPVYHLAGDKKLSDICIWVIHKNIASLLVANNEQETTDSSETIHDDSHEALQAVDSPTESASDDLASGADQHSPSILQGTAALKSSSKSTKTVANRQSSNRLPVNGDTVNPQQVTRSASNKKIGELSVRVTRCSAKQNSDKSPLKQVVTDKESTQSQKNKVNLDNGEKRRLKNSKQAHEGEKKNAPQSTRITRSIATRSEQSGNTTETEQRNTSTESHVALRNNSKERIDKKKMLSKKNSQENTSRGPFTRRRSKGMLKRNHQSSSEDISEFSSSEEHDSMSDSDVYATGSHAAKIGTKRKLFGHKGISSTPRDDPDIRNVVMLQSVQKNSPKKQVSKSLQHSTTALNNTRKNIDSDIAQSPSHNLRSHVQSSNIKTRNIQPPKPASPRSNTQSTNTASSSDNDKVVSNIHSKSKNIQSPRPASLKRILRSNAQSTNSASAAADEVVLNITSKSKNIQSPKPGSPKRIFRKNGQSTNSSSDDDEVVLNITSKSKNIQSPKPGSPKRILRSQASNVVLSPKRNSPRGNKPSTQSVMFHPQENEKATSNSKNQQSPKSLSPSKNLRAHTKGPDNVNPDVAGSEQNDKPDSQGNSRPTTPSGSFYQKRKSQSPKQASPVKKLRSQTKSLDTEHADVEMSENEEMNSQTSSRTSTPSGMFQLKLKKLSMSSKAKGLGSGDGDVAQKQLDNTHQSSTINQTIDGPQSKNSSDMPSQANTHNATCTSSIDDAPSTSSTTTSHNAPSTSSSHNLPSTSSAHNVPSTSNTNNAPSAHNVPSTSNTNNAPSAHNVPSTSLNTNNATSTHNTPCTSTSQNAPTTSSTHNAPSTSSTVNAPNTSSTHNAPGTSSTSDGNPQSDLRGSYCVPSGYTKLSNVQLGTVANVYGVVKYFKPPWKSRGTDMCSVVVLADPSTDDNLECVLFNKDAAFLPQVRRIGDIVRLHRMNIKRYQDKFQALSTRGFSAIAFDRDVSIPVSQDVARFSTTTFTFDNNDKDIVKTLKEWRVSLPDLFEPAKFLTVSEVEPDLYFDIVCQVKGVYKQKNLDCICLKVTDGTDPNYEIKSCDGDDSFDTTVASDPNQCPFTTFDVYLYGDHAMLLLNLKVANSDILLLHNVHSTAVQGGPVAGLLDVIEPTIELCMHRGSEYGRGLSILSQDSSDAQNLLQRLSQTP